MSKSQLLAKEENETSNKESQLEMVNTTISNLGVVSSIKIHLGTGLPLSTVTARLRDLEKAGLIRKKGKDLHFGRWYSTYCLVKGAEEQVTARANFEKARQLKAAQVFIRECGAQINPAILAALKSEIKAIEAA